jgi:serine protease Do
MSRFVVSTLCYDFRRHPRYPVFDFCARLIAIALISFCRAHAELPQTIEAVKPAVVGIATYQKTRTPAAKFLGTGFAVVDGRHVITNAHVLPPLLDSEKNEILIVLTGSGQNPQPREATTVAIDHEHDVALLTISGEPLPALRIGDSNTVREGQSLAFTGYPIGIVLGLHPVTHRGMVSAISPIVLPGRKAQHLDEKAIKRLRAPYLVFQLDATAYPGNSGSPLYDPATGMVYGIINMVFVKGTKESVLAQPSGITYAIPVNFIRDLLRGRKLLN